MFQENAEGELQACSQLDLARAIRQAVDAGAQVINVSGGQLASGGKAEPFLAEAVRLRRPGCVDRRGGGE